MAKIKQLTQQYERTKVCEEDPNFVWTMYHLGPDNGIGISFTGYFIPEAMTFWRFNPQDVGFDELDGLVINFGNHEDGRLVSGI